MQIEDLGKWRKAGRLTAEVREFSRTVVRPGTRILDAVEIIEKKIYELGGEPAFPVNISLNDCAAHYTPVPNDETIFSDQLVKVDCGVHVDGCIGDTAVTIDLSGKYADLVNAAKEALEAAIATLKDGGSLGEIGATVHSKITSKGFSPVINLSGHGLNKFVVHDSPNVPNYDTGDARKVAAGSIIAIEPFASLGKGEIYESGNAMIFSVSRKAGIRNIITKKVFQEIEKYRGLPFCTRWLAKKFPEAQVNYAMRDLKQLGVLHDYPPLVDVRHGMVSQAEHTIFVGEDGIEVLTKV
ncbi:type II methionyl aminopeptidase [Candidatus Woesearchaeota archaeon]|nr:type II methionyl aminopeptidase [Candidatus Woesearchaeota archaeon]